MHTTSKIDELRDRLSTVDLELVDRIAERQKIVAEIGKIKQANGRGLRDFNRERVVFDNALARAKQHDLNPRLVEDVVGTLIQYSLLNQEQNLIATSSLGSGQSVLVIGGAGRMGRWFAEMFVSQGFNVSIADPGLAPGPGSYTHWQDAGIDFDIIVVATPISVTNQVLGDLSKLRPTGLVFDIGSLKTPVRDGLNQLAAAGCRVASLHPMFGPDTELLSGHHMIFVDAGCPGATSDARALFAGTMVEQVDMDLEEHDKMIAFVLGLSHALNIVFFNALESSGLDAQQLVKMSSTTFDSQLLIAAAVARENPNLYFEIQKLNEYGDSALEVLCESANRVKKSVLDGDQKGFVEIMQKGHEYFAYRRKPGDQQTSQQSLKRRVGD